MDDEYQRNYIYNNRVKFPHFIIVDDALRNGFIQHFLIPLLQSFRLGNLLVYWVAMEDVVIPFTGWTCPDVTCRVPDRGAEVEFIRKKILLQIKRWNLDNRSIFFTGYNFLRLNN